MKITKISIKNYRSCIDTEFEPDGHLSALIGPNGSGKTNILSAIRLLASLCTNRGRYFGRSIDASPTCEIKTCFDIGGKQVVHTANLILVADEKNQDQIIDSKETWYMYDFNKKRTKFSIPSWLIYDATHGNEHGNLSLRSHAMNFARNFGAKGISNKELELLGTVVNVMSEITYYSASQFTNPGICPISFEAEGENRRTSNAHRRFLNEMYNAMKDGDENYDEFIEIIGPNGINLIEKIEFNEVETSTSSYSVSIGGKVKKNDKSNLLVIPSFEISGSRLSPSQLSEGSFKTLALIFYLVTDRSAILMLEEPEVCVHYGLLCSIVELIKIYSADKQIFISTHSDAVLDKLEIENVFPVKRTVESGTLVSNIRKNMKRKDLSALKNFLLNDGNLGEFWRNGDLENV